MGWALGNWILDLGLLGLPDWLAGKEDGKAIKKNKGKGRNVFSFPSSLGSRRTPNGTDGRYGYEEGVDLISIGALWRYSRFLLLLFFPILCVHSARSARSAGSSLSNGLSWMGWGQSIIRKEGNR